MTAVSVLMKPVNDTPLMSGCPARATPASGPKPVTTFQTASGSPASVATSSQPQHGQHRSLRGLHDDRIAGGECWRNAPTARVQRAIPGNDGRHGAVDVFSGPLGPSAKDSPVDGFRVAKYLFVAGAWAAPAMW